MKTADWPTYDHCAALGAALRRATASAVDVSVWADYEAPTNAWGATAYWTLPAAEPAPTKTAVRTITFFPDGGSCVYRPDGAVATMKPANLHGRSPAECAAYMAKRYGAREAIDLANMSAIDHDHDNGPLKANPAQAAFWAAVKAELKEHHVR